MSPWPASALAGWPRRVGGNFRDSLECTQKVGPLRDRTTQMGDHTVHMICLLPNPGPGGPAGGPISALYARGAPKGVPPDRHTAAATPPCGPADPGRCTRPPGREGPAHQDPHPDYCRRLCSRQLKRERVLVHGDASKWLWWRVTQQVPIGPRTTARTRFGQLRHLVLLAVREGGQTSRPRRRREWAPVGPIGRKSPLAGRLST